MDKFLDMNDQPRLNQEDINHLNGSITSNEWSSDKKSPKKESPGPDGFTDEFYQTFKEELIPTLLRLFHEIEREIILPKLFMKPVLYLFQNQIDTTKKKRIIGKFLINLGTKILNKTQANQIQHIKKITHHDQPGFIPEM
jgi:hypothetical protein